MFVRKKKCPYCDPYPYDNWAHTWGKLEKILFPMQYFFKIFDSFIRTKSLKFFSFFNKIFINNFFKISIIIGLLKEVDIYENDERLCSRIIVVIQAAQKRNITIKALKVFGKWRTQFYSLTKKEEKIIFEGLPSIKIDHIFLYDFDDKFFIEQMLKNNNMPNAQGRAFYKLKTALLYAKMLGFPLVIKPRNGSLSKHITCNIQNEEMLIEAIRVVKEISREFILEKFIPGDVYRITIVDNNFMVCCLREPPNIIGDGLHNIAELIKIKNDNSLRGDINQRNFTLHKIILDEKAVLLLESQGYSLGKMVAVPIFTFSIFPIAGADYKRF